ncbi:MAG: DUF3991 and toprim domain-containing protein, partial [Candidatus Omnitrophica bacterium]|nr:DUF3991 and toprim domain-containing protein [Candidatus Omnitrophota bacterium]
RTMTFGQRRELARRLRAIPLEQVLPLCGGRPDGHDPHKWHTPAGTLSLTGPKFMNWTLGAGGGGAIDLVIHLRHLDFKGALDWLAGNFSQVLPPEPARPPPPCELRLPPPAPSQLARVRHYLIAQRRLPSGLVDSLIDSGSLYADARANAVFVLRDPQNHPVGAELRGTTPVCWRGMAPGSRKDLGCFGIPADPHPAIILCESAIDAISCFTLHPQYRCLSTSGARPNPRWLVELLNQDHRIYCGFDADPTGDAMAQAMISLYPAIQRLRPSRKDWNDVLRSRA